MYFDRTGSVISEEDWKAYWAEEEYRLLARTERKLGERAL